MLRNYSPRLTSAPAETLVSDEPSSELTEASELALTEAEPEALTSEELVLLSLSESPESLFELTCALVELWKLPEPSAFIDALLPSESSWESALTDALALASIFAEPLTSAEVESLSDSTSALAALSAEISA